MATKRDPAPAVRVFQIRPDAEHDGAPVQRVSFGAHPRVDLVAGTPFQTSDERLAARLAGDPQLEEVPQP